MKKNKKTVTAVRSIKKGPHAGKIKVFFGKSWIILYKEDYDKIMNHLNRLGKRYLKGSEILLKCDCEYCVWGLYCISSLRVLGRNFEINDQCPFI